MDFFVPDRWNSFPHISELSTISSLIKIDERDLPAVLAFWKKCETLDPRTAPCEAFMTETACKYPVERGKYVDYMLNGTVTGFAGAFEGKDKKTADIIVPMAFDVGYHLAMNGFSLRYGGGITGLMGQYLLGYLKGLAERKRLGLPTEHMKIVQATSAYFLMPDASRNGNRPPNEGLVFESDAVVIFPGDLTNRISFMRSFCEAFIAAPGAMGTPHEIYDVITEIKIGLKSAPLYCLDPLVPATGRRSTNRHMKNRVFRRQNRPSMERYFEHLFAYNQQIADRGMITQEQNASFAKRFYDVPSLFACLMKDLKEQGRLPEDVFRINAERLLTPSDPASNLIIPTAMEIAQLRNS